MLIIFYHPTLGFGGTERRFVRIAREWERKGVKFHVLEPKPGLYLRSHRAPVLIRATSSSASVVRGVIFTTISIIMGLRIRNCNLVLACNNDIFNVLPALIISRLIRKPCAIIMHHYDIIDGEKLVTDLLGIYRLARKTGYGPFYSSLKALAIKVAMVIARSCKVNICVSKAFSRIFPNSQLSSNAVDLGEIDSASGKGKEYDACFVGRLDPRKGVKDLLISWRMIVDRMPKAKLALVGEDRLGVMELVRSYSLDGNVNYLGTLSDKKMYEIIKSSRVFVTLSTSEGWGIVIAEALACGVPVVCYRIVTLYENWEECPYVTFARPYDIKDVADKLLKVMNEPTPDSNKIRSHVDNLDWESVATRDWEILERVINKG
ncbi:MAG: glycosyltransferase family 4 protein [Nitrososphaerales archaeon]